MVFLLVSLFDMGMCKSSQVLNFSIIIIAVVWGCTVHLSMSIILQLALTSVTVHAYECSAAFFRFYNM